MQLEEIIIEKIRKEGPVSFRDFMEMCLYYPGSGYYTSAGNKTGTSGDYSTNANLTAAFGAMIGRQLEEMYDILGEKNFTIVEYGAGAGFLCNDIIQCLKHNKKLYSGLRYCIIEKSPAMREKEQKNIRDKGKVYWYDSIEDIPEVIGCIFSNELVDNLPVHLVYMADELMEIFVDYNYKFTELLVPAKKPCKNYLEELQVVLPNGFRTEINLDATNWINEAAGALRKGWIMTLDYGYTATELYRDSRSRGTLLCYNHHSINDCPYNHIGRQDITSHVNFSALHHWGLKAGLSLCGLTNQANFLLELGLEDYFANAEGRRSMQDYKKDALLKHELRDMGNRYKVLIQQKGVAGHIISGVRSPRASMLQPSIDPMII
jgi:SAM-dependent MidA family methyltransferase